MFSRNRSRWRWGAVFAIVLAVSLPILYNPPFRVKAIVLKAIGRSPNCPLSNAMESKANERLEEDAKNRILHASKRLEKDAQGFELWDTPKGRYWIPDKNQFVLPFNLGEQDRQIYGSGEHFIHPGDIVLDCGANVGVFVKSALNAGAKKVIAIEPGPENLECLRRNYRQEIADGKVILVPKGVWDKDDVLTLTVSATNSAADTFVMHPEDGKPSLQVPLTTIDKLKQELGLERVDFIKMDIEGSEVKALAGAKETLAKDKPRIAVSAYHAPDHPVAIPNTIRSARSDYQMACGPCAFTPEGLIRPDILYFY